MMVESGVTSDEASESDRFSLLIAHRGIICQGYLHGVVGLQNYCVKNGISFQITTTEQISSIDTARNLLASKFLLQATATHMLFIDDDMGFNLEEVVKMFEWRDKDVVAAMYPQKGFDWQRMKQIVLSNPDIEPAHLPSLAAAYDKMFVLPGEASEITVTEKPVPVMAIGTGLMLISRQCLLRLVELANLPTVEHDPVIGGTTYEFFKTQIHMGEDFYFCNLVRRYGGEVLGCPWLTVTHTGQYSFVGDVKGLARYLSKG
jgi:hypothetical protein